MGLLLVLMAEAVAAAARCLSQTLDRLLELEIASDTWAVAAFAVGLVCN